MLYTKALPPNRDLMSLLQAVMKDDQEDSRIRMAFLARKYALVADSKAAD
jgi:hypothetical protein